MEALIAGLHTAGNITRLKLPVPAYGQVRDEIAAAQRDLTVLEQKGLDASRLTHSLETQLLEQLSLFDPNLLDTMTNLPELVRQIEHKVEDATLIVLANEKREAEVCRQNFVSVESAPAAAERTRIEIENQSSRAALDIWIDIYADYIEALLLRAEKLFVDVSVSTESSHSERSRMFIDRFEADLNRIERLLNSHQAAVVRRDEQARELAAARIRLTRLDDQISGAAAANEATAKLLSELNANINDNICPVCDRDFSDVSDVSLSDHLAAKIALVIEHATRLQSLLRDRKTTSDEIIRFDRARESAVGAVLAETEVTVLKARAADISELRLLIVSALPAMLDGERLRSKFTTAAQALLSLQNSDKSAIIIRDSLNALARRLGLLVINEIPTVELLRSVSTSLIQLEASITQRQAARRSIGETLKAFLDANEERSRLKVQYEKTENDLLQLSKKKSDADKVIDLAKELAKQVREARRRVVQHVFNDELNAAWRDLFVRLAPEEPFIPAFAIPDTAGAEIEAVLETHHRRGGKGGNPRAMLSAGNLNTAALTLFLALNLSVEARLPLLVIDDPVQSMDEVHIAQFAALLRTLSKQMQRQVIIAVHERSLYDYLALELSPAFPGDRLNLIELGRDAFSQTICTWDPRLYVPDRAVAA